MFSFVAALSLDPTPSSEPLPIGPHLEPAHFPHVSSSSLTLARGDVLMVLVEGPPSAARLEARAHLEIYLRQQGLLVLNHRALGPDRSYIDDEQVERCWSMGVEHLLLVSVEASGDDLRTRVRSLRHPNLASSNSAHQARWRGVRVDVGQFRIISEQGASAVEEDAGMKPGELVSPALR